MKQKKSLKHFAIDKLSKQYHKKLTKPVESKKTWGKKESERDSEITKNIKNTDKKVE